MRRLTLNQFVERAVAVHGTKYDYSNVVYTAANLKVEIICPNHGPFLQVPDAHTRGQGCPQCGAILVSVNQMENTEEFVHRCRSIHGDRYDYSRVNYTGIYGNITIRCPDHGWFVQVANNHITGRGCRKCADAQRALSYRTHTDEFVRNAVRVHGDVYDYSHVDYVNRYTDVQIVCRTHGPFRTQPRYHIKGRGCLACSESSGERSVRLVLQQLQNQHLLLKWQREVAHDLIRDRRLLRFDFFVTFLNGKFGFIEYNGDQHYQPMRWSGYDSVFMFQRAQHRDRIKVKRCRELLIPLLVVPYWSFDKIEDIVTNWVVANGRPRYRITTI